LNQPTDFAKECFEQTRCGILVVDAETEKMIDAKTAHYVVGSKIRGTMSPISKIAFASRAEAEAFRKRYGGKIMNFEHAFGIALAMPMKMHRP